MDGVVCVVLCMPTISYLSFPCFVFSSCVVWIYELVSKFVVSSSHFSVPSPFFGVGPFILRYWVLECLTSMSMCSMRMSRFVRYVRCSMAGNGMCDLV